MAKAWEYGLIAALIATGVFFAGRSIEGEHSVNAEAPTLSEPTDETSEVTADEYFDQGLDLYYGDTEAEEIKGVDYLKKSHALGHIQAAQVIGRYYQYQKKDLGRAAQWYQQGVERGDGDAMVQLARFYQDGKHVEKDEVKAFDLFKQAADNETDGGLFNVGMYYKNGKVVEQDVPKAITYFERAHEAGYQKAGNAIARLYERGEGVPADAKKAYHWYLLGSEAGWAWSFTKLGEIHSQGLLGQPVDNAKAYGWYMMAKDEGWSSAVDQGKAGTAKLSPLLTEAEIQDAQQKAKDCYEFVIKHCKLQ